MTRAMVGLSLAGALIACKPRAVEYVMRSDKSTWRVRVRADSTTDRVVLHARGFIKDSLIASEIIDLRDRHYNCTVFSSQSWKCSGDDSRELVLSDGVLTWKDSTGTADVYKAERAKP